jgi:hypothetical protein
MFLDFGCRCRFITGCFLVLECMGFFCSRMFPDFGIQWCFASRYSMTLLLCVVLHPDIPWLCYYVVFYILIFHDFVTMCCFTSRYSMTLLLCVVLYTDIPWLCYYVLFYITDLVYYTYFHWFFNPECQRILGKHTGYIFQYPKKNKAWTTKHYASLNQWYNTE